MVHINPKLLKFGPPPDGQVLQVCLQRAAPPSRALLVLDVLLVVNIHAENRCVRDAAHVGAWGVRALVGVGVLPKRDELDKIRELIH